MKCPNCDEVLVMSERQGIEIDYCPKCRGVWLDRGELDKIIEKSVSVDTFNSNSKIVSNEKQGDYRDWPNDRHKDYNKSHYKRKGNFLSDLFD